MKIGVIQFPGSNCERETKIALSRNGMVPVDLFWHATQAEVQDCSGYVIAGGFSYQDRIRSGVIAARSPIIGLIAEQNKRYGKPILGICNGAQILVESGLVPGLDGNPIACALHDNKQDNSNGLVTVGFYNAHADLMPLNTLPHHAFTNQFQAGETINIPFAHAQGRFIIPPPLLKAMLQKQLPLFQYCGQNPNGSDYDLAAVTNFQGNIMAMMPHPERTGNGDKIFASMRHYIKSQPSTLSQTPQVELPLSNIRPFVSKADEPHFFVELKIEDNTASSLRLHLMQQGFDVNVKRLAYWQIGSDQPMSQLLPQLEKNGELFNSFKQKVILPERLTKAAVNHLVISKDSNFASNKLASLHNHFKMTQINALGYGELYQFFIDDLTQQAALEDFIHTHHLTFNPYSQDCYDY